MAVSIYQLGYKKLSQIIFEWQASDRASLLAMFIVMEIITHWLWCLFVWLRQDTYGTYVDTSMLYPVWIGVTLIGLFFWWMMGHLAHIKNDDKYLHKLEVVLIAVYGLYISVVVLVMGYSSLVAGVSLMGGTMLAMMLVRRRYIWKAFLFQVILILLVTIIPYLGVSLPNMRQMTITSIPIGTYSYLTYSEMTTIENALSTSIFQNGTLSWENFHKLRLSSAFFWRSTHIYLALPKAIFIVYMFRTLLLILDKSKEEVLKHASQDELTQLKSRRYGLKKMQQAIMSATDEQDFSVILLDLDLFKSINDNYGHEVGDQVLREVGQILSDALTDNAIVSRYGGEEFLIVLPDTGYDSAMAVAEQLRQDIAQNLIKTNTNFSFQVTASLGLYAITYSELTRIKQECTSDVHTEIPTVTRLQRFKSRKNKVATAESLDIPSTQLCSDICQYLISTADKALYKAKDRGRNQVVSANDLLTEGCSTTVSNATNTKSLYGT